jgi:hypothetical protein
VWRITAPICSDSRRAPRSNSSRATASPLAAHFAVSVANAAISLFPSGFPYTRAASASTLGTPKKSTAAPLSAVSGPEPSRSRSAAPIDSAPSQ